MAEWMTDANRRPWVVNSLDVRIKEMQRDIQKLRRAFAKDYMGEPANWLADAYEEALAALIARRAALNLPGSPSPVPAGPCASPTVP
jgi:hypothetical protein